MRINSTTPLRAPVTPHPHTLAIALTERCNYDCFFCTKQDHPPAPNLPFERLEALTPFIRDASMVDITGWGEPFLYPRIDEVIDLINAANQKGCISITTNGFLLNEERARKLSANLHHMVLSLNAATAATYERDMVNGKWDRVLANVAAARKHIPGDKMIFSMVTHRDNVRELPEFVRLAHRFGVTQVAVTLMIVTRTAAIRRSLWFDKALANELIEEAREVGKELGVYVGAPTFSPIATRAAPRPICQSPFRELFVYIDGKVKPCCFAGEQTMGTLEDEGGLEAVWNGPRYQALRRERFFPECKTCFAHASLADLDTHVSPWLRDPATRYGDLPRFSVILPVDEGADPVESAAALRSLAWQSYPAWECLVAVAGGEERLPAPLRQELARQPKARLVTADTLPAALEAALREAGGQAVAALVPGARWHPVKLERLLQELMRDPGPADGVVHGTIDATAGRAPRQGCVLRAEAARAHPAEALEALLGRTPASGAFAVSSVPDRLDVRVPGVGGDRREAWLDAVARRLNLLGQAALEAGDGPAALEAFQAALEADPLRAETHHNLALAARAGGHAPEARLHVQQALRFEPANPVFKATERALRAAG
jgi:MoaA/NifB/PqqE/SkfB family radical SAM enzyme